MPADVAVYVGKHQVLPNQAKVAARLKTFFYCPCPVQCKKSDGALIEDFIIGQCPVPLEHGYGINAGLDLCDHRPVNCLVYAPGLCRAIGQAVHLITGSHLKRLVFDIIGRRVLGIDPENIQVGNVGHHIGPTPGQAVIVADDDPRNSGHGCARDPVAR